MTFPIRKLMTAASLATGELLVSVRANSAKVLVGNFYYLANYTGPSNRAIGKAWLAQSDFQSSEKLVTQIDLILMEKKNREYKAHLHVGRCANVEGHYMNDVNGGVNDDNEAWQGCTTHKFFRSCHGVSTNSWVPRADTLLSIVVHDTPNCDDDPTCSGAGQKMLCADLEHVNDYSVDCNGEFEYVSDYGGTSSGARGAAWVHSSTADPSTAMTTWVWNVEQKNTEYTAHLHQNRCETGKGGAHYQDSPGGDTEPPNELWTTCKSKRKLFGIWCKDSDDEPWLVRLAEAQSVVFHDKLSGGEKMLCANLKCTVTKKN